MLLFLETPLHGGARRLKSQANGREAAEEEVKGRKNKNLMKAPVTQHGWSKCVIGRERESNKCLICDSALIASSAAVWSNTCDFYAHMAAAVAVYFCFLRVLTVSHQV